MGEWMATMKEGGEVPTVLKPYFQAQEAPQNAPQESTPANVDRSQLQALGDAPQSTPRPSTNQGVAQATNHSTSGDVWKRAASDFEFYQQNRAELRKAYYAKRNNRFKQ